MGFYIKKGFNFGPIRVNLSKSGVGFSLGAKGLRIGSGPKGNYLHAGKAGLYYRKSLASTWSLPLLLVFLLLALGYAAVHFGFVTLNF